MGRLDCFWESLICKAFVNLKLRDWGSVITQDSARNGCGGGIVLNVARDVA